MQEEQPPRVLTLVDTTSVVIGAMIGVGIFFTPTEVARLAGSETRALAAWGLGGLVALAGGLTFAELGRRYPRAGGQYDVLRDTWGPFVGFLYVCCNLTAMQTGSIAIMALVCVEHLAVAFGVASPSGAARLLASLALIAGLAFANALGARPGARIQNLTVLAKLLTLATVVAIATVAGPGGPARTTGPGASIWAALLPTLFSYGGWQQALWVGGEVRDGERTLPRATMIGVLIVVAGYLAAAWAYFALLGFDGVAGAETLAAEAVASAVPGAERAVALAVAVSAFGVLNANLLTGPRLVWALSRDGRFFPVFGRLAASGAPVPAILLLSGLTAAILLVVGADGIGPLTAWVVVLDAAFFAATGLAVPFLRLGGPVTRVVAIVFALLEGCAVLGALVDPSVRGAALVGLAWVGATALVYALWFRRPSA